MAKQFENLDYWLLDEQEDQLKIVRQTLRIVNNAQCKIIFAILSKHDDATCLQIQQLGKSNLDKARVYQDLVKLEKLNFVDAKRIKNLIHYSLVKTQVVDFIDCVNVNLKSVTIDDALKASNILEVNYADRGVPNKCILDYDLTSHLQNCLNCMISPKQKGILKMFFTKLNRGEELSKNNHEQQTTHIDKDFVDTIHKQSTVSRNLIALAKCNFIIRTQEKNFRHNSLNVDHIQKINGFLSDTSNLNFNKKNAPRRPIIYKPIKFYRRQSH